MAYERVTVVLNEHDMAKLRDVAQREFRRPRDQAAYMLIQILQLENKNNIGVIGSEATHADVMESVNQF